MPNLSRSSFWRPSLAIMLACLVQVGCSTDRRQRLGTVRADWMDERQVHEFSLASMPPGLIAGTPTGTTPETSESATPPPRILDDDNRRHGLFSLRRDDRKPWHIDLGFRVSHTKLAETGGMLEDRLETPMAFDVFNLFDSPQSPLDRKSEGRLNALYLGFGRSENDWLTWSLYFVGGAITDHETQRRSVLKLKTTFEYGNYMLGLKTELYPWGRPDSSFDMSWQERLENTKPFFFTGVETGYVSGGGRGRYEVASIPLYRDEVKIRDWVVGIPIGVGLWLPLDDRWSFIMSADYSWHVYRSDEYSGWNLNAGLRYTLR
ncbi:MAG: hypothetical protein ACPGXK_08550 [Phycisphaerae bacterium]